MEAKYHPYNIVLPSVAENTYFINYKTTCSRTSLKDINSKPNDLG